MTTVGRPATAIVSGWPPPRDRRTRAPYFSFFNVSNTSNHPSARSSWPVGWFAAQRVHAAPVHTFPLTARCLSSTSRRCPEFATSKKTQNTDDLGRPAHPFAAGADLVPLEGHEYRSRRRSTG